MSERGALERTKDVWVPATIPANEILALEEAIQLLGLYVVMGDNDMGPTIRGLRSLRERLSSESAVKSTPR